MAPHLHDAGALEEDLADELGRDHEGDSERHLG